MGSSTPGWLAWVTIAMLFVGCAGPGSRPAPSSAPEAEPPAPTAPKRVSLALVQPIDLLYSEINAPGSGVSGVNAVQELLNTGLTEADPTGVSQPQLAEAVPSIENGLWTVFPDGRMETTWKLKPGLRWHDGTSYTSADLAFTVGLFLDRELTMRSRPAYASIDAVEAPDDRTVTIKWARSFIEAPTMFSRELGLPVPRHVLEATATSNKPAFATLPYWSDEFVGTGAFKLAEFERGSHLILRANEQYALGRPKLDEIEVRFAGDLNVLVANFLVGNLDLFLGPGLDLERAIDLAERWKDGRVEPRPSGISVIHAQFLNPNPPVMTNVQFRRALLHAIDRQQLVDSLLAGRASVAHVYLGPSQPEYRDVEASIVRYDYEPRRATQLIEGLGYAKGAEGAFRDGANQRLSVELRSDAQRTAEKALFAVADNWQQIGLGVEPVVIPQQRASDLEYRYTFPALYLSSHSIAARILQVYHGAQAPLPENRWAGTNRGRYMNAELDALIDRYFITIPVSERIQVLRAAIARLTEDTVVLPLLHSPEFTVIGNRVQNMVASQAADSAKAWNVHLWDVKAGG